jgi:hypothetical protein
MFSTKQFAKDLAIKNKIYNNNNNNNNKFKLYIYIYLKIFWKLKSIGLPLQVHNTKCILHIYFSIIEILKILIENC